MDLCRNLNGESRSPWTYTTSAQYLVKSKEVVGTFGGLYVRGVDIFSFYNRL